MRIVIFFAAVFLTPIALSATTAPTTEPSSPEAILAAIDALPRPELDRSRSGDAAYMQSYDQIMDATWKRQAELELLFCQKYPNDPRAESIQIRRLSNALTQRSEDPAQIQKEVDQFFKDHPNGPASEDDREQMWRLRERLADGDATKLLALAKDYASGDPRNETGATFYLNAAEATHDWSKTEPMLRQIMQDYPNSPGGIRAGGILRRHSQIGMPFDLGFNDVKTGEWTHTHWLRGKVVVVDFWATWCGPCVGEIPHLKQVQAKYKDRVEILGVSLDSPGEQTPLETFKAFLDKNQITWPQYYQGDAFDSAFSSSWGIYAIPCVFVIDQQGRLYSTEADHDKLDPILAKLLPDGK